MTIERTPEKLTEWLLTAIGSRTSARWDQWLRYEAGDEAADETIAWLEARGIRPYRPGHDSWTKSLRETLSEAHE